MRIEMKLYKYVQENAVRVENPEKHQPNGHTADLILKLTGISITREWTKADWYDFCFTLRAFEKRCAVRHGELPASQQGNAADMKEDWHTPPLCNQCSLHVSQKG